MNIVLLVNKLTDGGAERVASLWATGFCNEGHCVTMIIKNSSAPITYKVPEEIKLYRYNESPISSLKIFRILYKFRWLREIIKERNANAIISIDPDMSLAMYIATIGISVPIIHTAHNAFERPKSAPMSFRTKFEKFYRNKLYAHVTVLTQADKDVIGNRLSHVTVLPNPLTFEPVKSMPEKEKIVLASGRLDEWHVKGFDLLLSAWGKLGEEKDGWKLVILGGSKTGKGLDYIKKISSDLCLSDSVSFAGFQEDILSYYRKASIYVLSSRYEGFGMVLTEAMSQGCACIACDYKGRQRDIIGNDTTGIICRTDEVDDIVNGLRRLMSDDKLRVSMGKAAIERSEYFNLENTMKRWNQIFDKVL